MIMEMKIFDPSSNGKDPIQYLFELDLEIHNFAYRAHYWLQDIAPIIIRVELIHLGRRTAELIDDLDKFIDREFMR